MNILSLFDGMSCLQIAINRMGVKNYTYHASEIKKHAIKCTQHNYPDTIPIGDIRKVSGYDLPKIDFIGAGSPCQDFSIANKERKGLDGEKSGLFFEFVRILKECKEVNPDINFLLENVRMKKDQENTISEILGVKPIAINSNLVSAQNRYRLYWFNFGPQNFDLFGIPSPEIVQPDNKLIAFQSILTSGAAFQEKAFALTARYGPGLGQAKSLFRRHKKGFWNAVFEEDHIRELTIKEMERLQAVPEGYTENTDLSWRQCANLLGDGWTVDVICHILQYSPLFKKHETR